MRPKKSLERARRERNRRLFKIGAPVGAFLLIVGLLSWLSHYDRYAVESIVVEGNQVVNTEQIQTAVHDYINDSYFFLFSKKNALLFPRHGIKEMLLQKYRRLLSVDLNLNGANEVVVSVTERTPESLWCGATADTNRSESDVLDTCFLVDSSGFIFDHVPQISRDVYFTLYGPLDVPDASDPVGHYVGEHGVYETIMKLRTFLEGEGFDAIEAAEATQGDVDFLLSSGGTVRMNLLAASDDLLDVFKAALTTKEDENGDLTSGLEYIDARFLDSHKVYFKFK